MPNTRQIEKLYSHTLSLKELFDTLRQERVADFEMAK